MTKAYQRIMGIDPGSRITGVGIIDCQGNHHLHAYSNHLKFDGDFIIRLGDIHTQVAELVGLYKPDAMAIEDVFVAKNARSALKLGQARAAAICAALNANVPVFEYTPKAIKQAITGRGGADKSQMQQMVKLLLNLPEPPQADAADALAIALTHAQVSRYNAQLNHALS